MSGGPGFDNAFVTSSSTSSPTTSRTVIQLPRIGRLRLAPRVLKAEAGRTARLTMRWKHPKSWRELRKVQMKRLPRREGRRRRQRPPRPGQPVEHAAPSS